MKIATLICMAIAALVTVGLFGPIRYVFLGSEILIADDALSFACATAALLQDPVRRAQLGAAARQRVEERYSLATLAAALRNAFDQLRSLSNRARTPADPLNCATAGR